MRISDWRSDVCSSDLVSADGLNVRPVTVDEFQIGNAETYYVIIQPTEDKAFTFVAETIERSGMARATFAPRLGMTAPVPPLRPRPTLTMKDMGMGGMDHGSMAGMDHGAMSGTDHGAMAAGASAAAADHGSSHSMGGMNMRDKSKVPDSVKVGVGVDAIAMSPEIGRAHTSELQSLMRISYAVFCLKTKNKRSTQTK